MLLFLHCLFPSSSDSEIFTRKLQCKFKKVFSIRLGNSSFPTQTASTPFTLMFHPHVAYQSLLTFYSTLLIANEPGVADARLVEPPCLSTFWSLMNPASTNQPSSLLKHNTHLFYLIWCWFTLLWIRTMIYTLWLYVSRLIWYQMIHPFFN
jgi:hypothetical protein